MNALLRWIDVRPGELRAALSVFCVLLGIVASHTMLETVRDAMFLTHLGSRSLGLMYVVAAGLTLVVGGFSASLGSRLGARRALAGSLAATSGGVLVFLALPPTRGMLMSLYAFSAVTGAMLIPQFWASLGALFDAAQSRRLFRTIALAGILGAVVGAGVASVALLVVTVRALLPVVALGFAVAAGVVVTLPDARRGRPAPSPSPLHGGGPLAAAFRAEPILWRLAAVVAFGAATTLLVDFVFKTRAAASVPPEELGAYFARWGALMNVLSLVVQLAVARRILDRAGVVGMAGFTPSLIGLGSVLAMLSGGAAPAVLGMKVIDASLRHSVQRTGVELVYLAVPTSARDRAKPFIDGAIARAAQAAAAGLAIAATTLFEDPTGPLLVVVLALASAWGAATGALRRPYLALFRRALLGPGGAEARSPQELDMASLELLVEALGSERPEEVIAAMNALDRRGRAGIIPSVMLLHEAPSVIERALELFAASARRDWVRRAERLAEDPRKGVRVAALRALARTRSGDPSLADLASEHAWIRGYVTAVAAIRTRGRDAPELEAELARLGEGAEEGLLGTLTALEDAEPGGRAREVLVALVGRAREPLATEVVEAVARAATSVGAEALVGWLLGRLGARSGRQAVRAALAALRPSAFEELRRALVRDATPPKVRAQIPRVLQMFGDQQAADALSACVLSDAEGALRFRALRSLGRLVADAGVRIDEARFRRFARDELAEHLRVLGLREALAGLDAPKGVGAKRLRELGLSLLGDKAEQAMQRAFRAIKLCFPSEDIRRVHDVAVRGDTVARANAAEFLDALLAPKGGRRAPREDGLRPLLRLVTDQLAPPERASRGALVTGVALPADATVALQAVCADADASLAAVGRALEAALEEVHRAGGAAGRPLCGDGAAVEGEVGDG